MSIRLSKLASSQVKSDAYAWWGTEFAQKPKPTETRIFRILWNKFRSLSRSLRHTARADPPRWRVCKQFFDLGGIAYYSRLPIERNTQAVVTAVKRAKDSPKARQAKNRQKVATLIEKIDQRCKNLGISRNRLCLDIGENIECIRSIQRKGWVDLETLSKFARRLQVPVSYLTVLPRDLIRGFYEEIDDGGGPTIANSLSDEQDLYSERPQLPRNTGHVLIAAAPSGSWLNARGRSPETPRAPRVFAAALINDLLRGVAEDFYWAAVVGDFMAPALCSGDEVLIDRRATRSAGPAIFVIDDGAGLIARWVEHIPGSGLRSLRVYCTTPQLEPYDVPTEDLNIVGRVVWLSRQV